MPNLQISSVQQAYTSIEPSRLRHIRPMSWARIAKAYGSAFKPRGFSKRTFFGLFFLLLLGACSDKPADKPPVAPATPKAAVVVPAETAKPTESAMSAAPAPVSSSPNFTTKLPDQMSSLTVVTGAKCSIDAINQIENNAGWSIHRGTVINLGGWILDSAANTTSDWVVLRLEAPDQKTHFYVTTTARAERSDLVQAFGPGPGSKKASFNLSASTDSLPYGSYKLALVHQPAAAAQVCDSSKTLDIVQ